MTDLQTLDFATLSDLIGEHARQQPDHAALSQTGQSLSYAQLDALMDRVARSLQRDGLRAGDCIAVCASTSVHYAAVFLGALRAGVVVAPLAPSATPESLQGMLRDAQARLLFLDASVQDTVTPARVPGLPCISLDAQADIPTLATWLAPAEERPQPVQVEPDWAFNIIYSSGTTGEPKGIVQPHSMRWAHVKRGSAYHYSPTSVTLLSTPLYSNTTLVVFFPTLAYGGHVWLMPKFDALGYLTLAQAQGVTHTMLVPVQYQRIMARPEFDSFDLTRFVMKFSTSAPFSAALKADVLQRWPGGLTEFYGMTEGGGTCILEAHTHPDKLHTVGQPALGHDIRLINEDGVEVPSGEAGEVVGHSAGMMKGYHGQPGKTRDAEWFDSTGKRFIRTGDIGRFDADGFLTLFDRKKDMIISGGFNIYPSDLEAVLRQHPEVQDAAVVGVASMQWGETPVAFVVLRADVNLSAVALMQWVNERVGKTQRLSDLQCVEELPRSAIGKVLKRELRDRYQPTATAQAR